MHDDTPDPDAPSPPQQSTSAPEPYVFRPAEFRPAVFIPAEASHQPDDVNDTAARDYSRLPAAPVAPEAPVVHARESNWTVSISRVWEELVAWFKTLVSAAVYATIIVTFGFQVARVEGQSMVPTLEDQDRLIVNKLVYRFSDPRAGDVVMLYYPEDPEKSFVKRIVAEEGDTIRSVEGKVYRNEVLIDDSFIPDEYRLYDTWGPEIVRKGYYFVMGDHRNNSSDSRTWGQVPKKYIIGKVQLRWWPLGHAKIF